MRSFVLDSAPLRNSWCCLAFLPPPLMEAPPPTSQSCLPCRVTGTATFTGIAVWLVTEARKLGRGSSPGHKAVLYAAAGGFAGAAVIRWRT